MNTNASQSPETMRETPWGIHAAVRDCGLLLLLALPVHGWILLNDGIFWDGWLNYTFVVERSWDILHQRSVDAGLPLVEWLHRFMAMFPSPLAAYRVTQFSCVLAGGMLVYLLCRETEAVSRVEAMLLAGFTLLYPGHQLAFAIIVILYVTAIPLYLLGLLFAVRAEKRKGAAHGWNRGAALLALFLAIGLMHSLMGVHVAVVLLALLFLPAWNGDRSPRWRRMPGILLRRLDYLLLPFLVWVLKECFFPRRGLYVQYNQFTDSLDRVWAALLAFVKIPLAGQTGEALGLLVRHPVAWLLLLVAAEWGYRRFRLSERTLCGPRAHAVRLLFSGLVLYAAVALPYALVEKAPALHGWHTRQSLLLSVPVALLLVALAQLLFVRRNRSLSSLGCHFLLVLAVSFAGLLVSNYLSWQARWAKDRSVLLHLQGMQEPREASVVWVTYRIPHAGGEHYRFYEWSSMFKRIYGDESRIGLDTRFYTTDFLEQGRSYFSSWYNLGNFDPMGLQATLTVSRGPVQFGDAELALRYLYHRVLKRETMDPFLRQLTTVEACLVPSPREVDGG